MQRFALAEIAAGSLIGKLPSGLAVTIAVRDMSGAAIALTSAVCTEQGTTGMYRWALTNITVPPIVFAEYTYVMTSANNDTYEDAVIISGYPDVIEDRIGVPVNIDGGGANLAGNLKRMADDNNGADFDATNDSMHILSSHKIGVPIALDGGLTTIAGNLTKLADDNGGADYNAGTDSLHEISDVIDLIQIDTNNIRTIDVPIIVAAIAGVQVSANTIIAMITVLGLNITAIGVNVATIKQINQNKMIINRATSELWLYDDAGVNVIMKWAISDKDGLPVKLKGTEPANRGNPQVI
jgi:hypothetical protein